jgi:hypothetical protein
MGRRELEDERQAHPQRGQATTALGKTGAGTASVNLDLDSLLVLFSELALFAT